MENYNYIPAVISRIAVPCTFISGTLHKLFLYEFVNIYDTMKREINIIIIVSQMKRHIIV